MSSIEFRRLPLPRGIDPILFDIYYIVENGRPYVMEKFRRLPDDKRDMVKDLMIRMATVDHLKSPRIRYNLRGYNYGEIKPIPHRFFFFQKAGSNYIFFDYRLKKSDSLSDKVYREINQKKEKYENEFERFMQGH